jgi:hypothetical protein
MVEKIGVAIMTNEQLDSIQRLRDGLKFHDYFGHARDDAQVYVTKGEILYEFASLEGEGALRLGDLRNILVVLESM